MYQENLKYPWMYVDTVFCAFVRSCWMAYIASYWRSIKFNEFIARVQNKYYYIQEMLCVVIITMICSTLASSWNIQSFQRCIYPIEYIWCSAFFVKIIWKTVNYFHKKALSHTWNLSFFEILFFNSSSMLLHVIQFTTCNKNSSQQWTFNKRAT